MPYRNFTKTEEGKTKYCMEAINTGKTYCYDSEGAREKAKGLHEMFANIPPSKRKEESADEWVRKKMEGSQWTKKVDNRMRTFGDIDYDTKKIRINPKKGDVVDTILHEEAHKRFPNKTEKQIKKIALEKNKEISLRRKVELLKKYL